MLQLIDLSFEVENGASAKEIVRDINITIPEGSFTVITGPNGSGKSTLAKLIMGIEKPTAGKILYDGRDITGLSVSERAGLGIGFAFQQPVRFKGLTVKDLIELAAGKKLGTDEACVYLSEVGLCAMDYIGRELDSSLSGGELKRVEIAMIIARGTRLSVFDEPEAGIDLWSFQKLISVFEKMRDTVQGSIIIISHQERILAIANQIVVMSDGVVSQAGAREEILPGLLADSHECDFYQYKGAGL